MAEEPTSNNYPEEQTDSHPFLLRWKKLFRDLMVWLKKTIRIHEDTDYEATIGSISSSIVFKGINVWILFFAIIVASIGLNVNSTAVIIGAMLISPLMGPIMGIGLSVGINDNEMLRTSLRNLLIMMIISLLASSAYFYLSPLGDAQSELLARTRPTIFDVLIAFFGGAAGMIATSRKSQPFTVISGVAIATALMPPLCTAGYGLATAQFTYFFGAFYLFFINSFFISLSTFIITKYLHFPQKKYLNPIKAKRVKRYITVFAILVIIPSMITAFNVVKESSFNATANHFVSDIQKMPYFEHAQLINVKKEYGFKEQTLTLSVVGKEITPNEIEQLQYMLQNNYGLEHAQLVIKQSDYYIANNNENEVIENILAQKDHQIEELQSKIKKLETDLAKTDEKTQLMQQVAKEIAVQYPSVKSFSVVNMVYTNTKTLKSETKPTLFIESTPELTPEQQEEILKWLRVRLEEPKLMIK